MMICQKNGQLNDRISNIFSGALNCKGCSLIFIGQHAEEGNYRIQDIKRHILTARHQTHHRGDHNKNDLVFSRDELEEIRRLQLTYVAKNNLNFSIFR